MSCMNSGGDGGDVDGGDDAGDCDGGDGDVVVAIVAMMMVMAKW